MHFSIILSNTSFGELISQAIVDVFNTLDVRYGMASDLFEWTEFEEIKTELFGNYSNVEIASFRFTNSDVKNIILSLKELEQVVCWKLHWDKEYYLKLLSVPSVINCDEFLLLHIFKRCIHKALLHNG